MSIEAPLGWIVPSPANPRKGFDEEALSELAESIREHGLPTARRSRPAASG